MFCLGKQVYLGDKFGLWANRIINYDTGQYFFAYPVKDKTELLYFEEISKGKYKQLDKCPFDVKVTDILGLVPRKDNKGFIFCFISKEAWYFIDLVDSVETRNIAEFGGELMVYEEDFCRPRDTYSIIDINGVALVCWETMEQVSLGWLVERCIVNKEVKNNTILLRTDQRNKLIRIRLTDNWQLLYTKMKTLGRV